MQNGNRTRDYELRTIIFSPLFLSLVRFFSRHLVAVREVRVCNEVHDSVCVAKLVVKPQDELDLVPCQLAAVLGVYDAGMRVGRKDCTGARELTGIILVLINFGEMGLPVFRTHLHDVSDDCPHLGRLRSLLQLDADVPVDVVAFFSEPDGQVKHGDVGCGDKDSNPVHPPPHLGHHAEDLLFQLRERRRDEVLVKVPLDGLGVRRGARVGALDGAGCTGVLVLDRPVVKKMTFKK
jgi:hypothetical protein